MFYQYDIVSKEGEEILYIYCSLKQEFSQEFLFHEEEGWSQKIQNYILQKNIPFRGNKVYLIVNGIVVKVFDLKHSEISPQPDLKYSMEHFKIILHSPDKVLTISLKEYLISILFSFSNYKIHKEGLKAIAVLFATYAYKQMREKNYLSVTDDFALYQPLSYYQATLPNFLELCQSYQELLLEVDGVFLTYEKQFILPFIHYSNSGKTFTHDKYPYLSSVKSLSDMTSPTYVESHTYSFSELEKIFQTSSIDPHSIQYIHPDGKKHLVLGDEKFSLEEFRRILNLRSTVFYFIVYPNSFRIITLGCGNSYGLSIFGANDMAEHGLLFHQILKYYFPKTKLCKYVKEKELS